MAIFKKSVKKNKVDKKAVAPVKKAKVEKITTTKKVAATKTPTNIYYLSCRKDKNDKKIGWEIKRGNSKAISALCDTKEEAKIKVKEFAKNSKATVIIYKTDGKIDETYKIG